MINFPLLYIYLNITNFRHLLKFSFNRIRSDLKYPKFLQDISNEMNIPTMWNYIEILGVFSFALEVITWKLWLEEGNLLLPGKLVSENIPPPPPPLLVNFCLPIRDRFCSSWHEKVYLFIRIMNIIFQFSVTLFVIPRVSKRARITNIYSKLE